MKEDKIPDRSTQFLANERTFLAWLRTSLALIGLGFVVSRFGLFFKRTLNYNGRVYYCTTINSFSLLGISMVFLGAALIVYALKNYLEKNKAIQRGAYIPKNSPIYALTIGVVISIVILAFYLLLL